MSLGLISVAGKLHIAPFNIIYEHFLPTIIDEENLIWVSIIIYNEHVHKETNNDRRLPAVFDRRQAVHVTVDSCSSDMRFILLPGIASVSC